METKKEYALDIMLRNGHRFRYKSGFISPRKALASFDNSVQAYYQSREFRKEQGDKFIIVEQIVTIEEREMDPSEYEK